MDKKSFLLYNDYRKHLDLIDDDREFRLLIEAVFDYNKTGEITDNLPGIVEMAFSFIQSNLDLDKERSGCGEYHWNWKGGVSEENHVIRTSTEYKEWREAVFERDNYTCDRCKQAGGYLHAHHIASFADHPDKRLDIDNGITLCRECHWMIHTHDPMDFDGRYHG